MGRSHSRGRGRRKHGFVFDGDFVFEEMSPVIQDNETDYYFDGTFEIIKGKKKKSKHKNKRAKSVVTYVHVPTPFYQPPTPLHMYQTVPHEHPPAVTLPSASLSSPIPISLSAPKQQQEQIATVSPPPLQATCSHSRSLLTPQQVTTTSIPHICHKEVNYSSPSAAATATSPCICTSSFHPTSSSTIAPTTDYPSIRFLPTFPAPPHVANISAVPSIPGISAMPPKCIMPTVSSSFPYVGGPEIIYTFPSTRIVRIEETVPDHLRQQQQNCSSLYPVCSQNGCFAFPCGQFQRRDVQQRLAFRPELQPLQQLQFQQLQQNMDPRTARKGCRQKSYSCFE